MQCDLQWIGVIQNRLISVAKFIIVDITSELKNCTFTEIAPRTFYPLYGKR